GEPDEIEVGGIDTGRAGGGDLAGQFARIDLDLVLAPLHGHAHAKTFRVDEVGLRRQADQLYTMAAEQQLGGEERSIGSAHNQDIVGGHDGDSAVRVSKGAPAIIRNFGMVPLRISRSHQNHGSLVGVKAPCGRVVSWAPWLTRGYWLRPRVRAPLATSRCYGRSLRSPPSHLPNRD